VPRTAAGAAGTRPACPAEAAAAEGAAAEAEATAAVAEDVAEATAAVAEDVAEATAAAEGTAERREGRSPTTGCSRPPAPSALSPAEAAEAPAERRLGGWASSAEKRPDQSLRRHLKKTELEVELFLICGS